MWWVWRLLRRCMTVENVSIAVTWGIFGGPRRLKKSCTLKKCELPLKQHQRQRLTVCPQVQKYKEIALFTCMQSITLCRTNSCNEKFYGFTQQDLIKFKHWRSGMMIMQMSHATMLPKLCLFLLHRSPVEDGQSIITYTASAILQDNPSPMEWLNDRFNTASVLQQCGWMIHQVTGDGNCHFRAISFFLFGKEDYHDHVRTLLIRFENLNTQVFEGTLMPGVNKSRHTWGTYVIYLQGQPTLSWWLRPQSSESQCTSVHKFLVVSTDGK